MKVNLSVNNFVILFMLIMSVSVVLHILENDIYVSVSAQMNGNISDSEFHSYVEQMRGHLEASIENKEKNNTLFAIKHALHPFDEILHLIKDKMDQTNQTLSNELANKLEAYLMQIGSNSLHDTIEKKITIERILNKVLYQSLGNKLNDNDHLLNVTANLIDTTQEEYLESIFDGKIINMIEYQDGIAFLEVAIDIIQNNSNFIFTEEKQLLEKLNKIKNDMNMKLDPSIISSSVKDIVCQIKGGYYC